jgi:hypothetical protein
VAPGGPARLTPARFDGDGWAKRRDRFDSVLFERGAVDWSSMARAGFPEVGLEGEDTGLFAKVVEASWPEHKGDCC